MFFRLEPASIISQELQRKIVNATHDISNEWFFFDGAFTSTLLEHNSCNTWLNENFVVVSQERIVGYFEAMWSRPVDVISSFRMILFEKKGAYVFAKAFFYYIEYLFSLRGCMAFNWTVAKKNEYALNLYRKFIKKYFGHIVGERHHSQKSYSGKISDILLFEITRDEYFNWKANHACRIEVDNPSLPS